MRKSTLAAAVLMLAAFPGGVCADVVHLKNGRSFHGTIESETKASVVINTTDGGSITLPRGLIASIEHETVAPEAPVTTASSGGDEVPTARTVVRLLRAGDFDGATKALARVRALGRDPASGQSPYGVVTGDLDAVHSLWPILDRWCASSPRSFDAHLMRGQALTDAAFEARGSGWASSVTPEGWRLLRERLTQAKADLELAMSLDAKDPYAPTRLISVGKGLDLGDAELDEYYRLGAAADPLSLSPSLRRVWSLEPRWGGSNEAMFAFARKCAEDHPDDPKMAYAIISAHEDYASYTAGQANQAPAQAKAYLNRDDVKAETHGIYDRIVARYPKAAWAVDGRACLAQLEGDTAGWRSGLLRAAELGEPGSQNALGEAYGRGSGVPHDDAEAAKWFARAASAGNPQAQANLGYFYEQGIGVAKDVAKGVALLRDSAEMECPGGLMSLAECYHSGVGVPRDYAESARLLEMAVEHGDSRAEYDLGCAYYAGEGVPVDRAKGRRLIEAAAARGNALAKAALATLPRQ